VSRELSALKKRVGAKIKERRTGLGISQEELAFKADISPTYLSQIESGQRNPSLATLFNLTTALRLELSEVVKP
jgi:transcriptional regulator with XRE-family HTH domain